MSRAALTDPVAVAIEADLRLIIEKGWRNFRADQVPHLREAVTKRVGASDVAAIQGVLLDLLDPPVDGARSPLETRSRDDRGLLGRWIFGEPKELTFRLDDGESVTYKPASTLATERYNQCAGYRHEGRGTLMRKPRNPRGLGGPGWELLREVTLELAAPSTPVVPAADGDDTLELRQLRDAADAAYQQGDYVVALGLLQDALVRHRRELGTGHYRTMSVLHQTVYALAKLERFSEAVPLAAELLETRERVLGEADPRVADARSWLRFVSEQATGAPSNRSGTTTPATDRDEPPATGLPGRRDESAVGGAASTTTTPVAGGPRRRRVLQPVALAAGLVVVALLGLGAHAVLSDAPRDTTLTLINDARPNRPPEQGDVLRLLKSFTLDRTLEGGSLSFETTTEGPFGEESTISAEILGPDDKRVVSLGSATVPNPDGTVGLLRVRGASLRAAGQQPVSVNMMPASGTTTSLGNNSYQTKGALPALAEGRKYAVSAALVVEGSPLDNSLAVIDDGKKRTQVTAAAGTELSVEWDLEVVDALNDRGSVWVRLAQRATPAGDGVVVQAFTSLADGAGPARPVGQLTIRSDDEGPLRVTSSPRARRMTLAATDCPTNEKPEVVDGVTIEAGPSGGSYEIPGMTTADLFSGAIRLTRSKEEAAKKCLPDRRLLFDLAVRSR